MKKSKNVSLFLLDGEVTGRTKCTLANWTGVVYKIPRALLNESKDIPALNQSSIYICSLVQMIMMNQWYI